MNYIKLSKEISFALRHNPWQYELELDNQGFVQIDQLLYALNETNHYAKSITIEDLLKVIEISEKQRLEISGSKIRALYGHSIPMHIEKTLACPPDILYHGTTHIAVEAILKEGLKPMNRQYVHLSMDEETAIIVGKRRDESPVLLIIDALKAYENGIHFYIGNDKVWLSDSIPTKYIHVKND